MTLNSLKHVFKIRRFSTKNPEIIIIDPYDYHREERLKMQLLNPDDLAVITSIETSLTSERVGHVFMMCGVLYATEPKLEEQPGVIR